VDGVILPEGYMSKTVMPGVSPREDTRSSEWFEPFDWLPLNGANRKSVWPLKIPRFGRFDSPLPNHRTPWLSVPRSSLVLPLPKGKILAFVTRSDDEQLTLRDARLATGSLCGLIGEQGHLPVPAFLLSVLGPPTGLVPPLLFSQITYVESTTCIPHDIADKCS